MLSVVNISQAQLEKTYYSLSTELSPSVCLFFKTVGKKVGCGLLFSSFNSSKWRRVRKLEISHHILNSAVSCADA